MGVTTIRRTQTGRYRQTQTDRMTSYERKMAGRKAVKEREKEEREDYQKKYIEYLTELPYDKVDGTGIENDLHEVQASLHASVRADTRSTVQRTADELYESGILGASLAAVADILPGLPGVDIIDPPAQLSDKGMQSARNILGVVGGGGVMSKTPQAVGRVATNIRKPFGYGENLGSIKHGVERMQREYMYRPMSTWQKAKTLAMAVIKDEPLYGSLAPRVKKLKGFGGSRGPGMLTRAKYPQSKYVGLGTGDIPKHRKYTLDELETAMFDAREYLYRTMFGLKPRAGKNIFKMNKDGTLSFNPKSKRAKILTTQIRENVDELRQWEEGVGPLPLKEGKMSLSGIYGTGHPVMGGYSAKFGRSGHVSPNVKGKISYEDIWDFKMNPSEWKDIGEHLSNIVYKRDAGGFGLDLWQLEKASVNIGGAGVRTLVHSLTKPVHIKGSIPYFQDKVYYFKRHLDNLSRQQKEAQRLKQIKLMASRSRPFAY